MKFCIAIIASTFLFQGCIVDRSAVDDIGQEEPVSEGGTVAAESQMPAAEEAPITDAPADEPTPETVPAPSEPAAPALDGQRFEPIALDFVTLRLDPPAPDTSVRIEDGRLFVEASSPLADCPGCIRGHLALAIDGTGSNVWGWVEAAYGVESPLVRHEGWLLEADLGEGARYATATLVSDDASPRGFLLENVEAVEEALVDPGMLQVDCGVAGFPFELDWLVEGRCTRSQVDGQRVVLALW